MSRSADCGPRRPQKAASGEMEPPERCRRLGVCQVGAQVPLPLATCAILSERPGLSEVQSGPDKFS